MNHLSYFRRDESALPLFAAMEGDDRPFASLPGPSQIFISRGRRKTDPRPDATEASLRRNGIRDYYPLINALDGAFLNAVLGETASFDEHRAQLCAFLDEITADGRRRVLPCPDRGGGRTDRCIMGVFGQPAGSLYHTG